jgi:hypothetical protein
MSDVVKNTVLLWAMTVLGFIGCNLTPTQTAGGSSDTEVSSKTITGSVVDINGKPISNAAVWLNAIDSEENMTPVHQGAAGTPPSNPEAKPVMTDEQGMFTIADVKIGDYAIEVNSGDSIAVLLYCSFDSADTIKKLPVDTLKPMVVISGTVLPNGGGNPQISVDGINRPVKIDSTGSFQIKVPAGKHSIKFFPHDPKRKRDFVLPYLPPGAKLDMGFVDPSSIEPFDPCEDSACDASAMRLLLNDMGLNSVAVESVATFKNGRITAVNLRHRQLHFLSTEITRLTALQILDVGANQLRAPFQAFSLCTSLIVLRLDSNYLPFVENGIGAMLNLKELDLSNNEIASLPITIINLKPEILKLENNRLLDLSGAPAQWADTFEPNWRATQRQGSGKFSPKDYYSNEH